MVRASRTTDWRRPIPDGVVVVLDDPYRYWPTLGELDLYLLGEGRHEGLWHHLGAQVRVHQGTSGTSFAVWAPGARAVRVVGDFNGWDGRIHPMRALGSSGVWEIFLPDVGPGAHYKYEVVTQQGQVTLRADPFAFAAEVPPATASIVARSSYDWQRRGVVRPPGEHRPDARPGVDLRMPSGLVAVHPGRRRRVAGVDLPGGGRRCCPRTCTISASPTSSSCRSRSTRSPARGGTR